MGLMGKLFSLRTRFRDAETKRNLPHLIVESESFLRNEGALAYLERGAEEEFRPMYHDLANLYRLIRSRRPQVVLEFGVGFSSILMAYALKRNSEEGHPGKLWTVDPEQYWLENTSKKVPEELQEFVTFHYSTVSVRELSGQLCFRFDSLPNIVPNFVYLDGPSSASVQGEIDGLGFGEGGQWLRADLSADILLYESSAPNDFYILVDGRAKNVNFLKRNLKGRYEVQQDNVRKLTTFEYLGERALDR